MLPPWRGEGAAQHLPGVKLPRRLVITVAVAAVAVAALAGVGIYGLLVGPPDRPEPTASPTAPEQSPQPGQGSGDGTLVPIAVTTDAETFARSVALALFEWDTTRTGSPVTIVEHVMAVAEPGGNEAHGLFQDVQGYLPTAQQWRQLREYETRQRLSIQALFVPESWAGIIADPANGIGEGVVAVTVDGIRVREGGWHGQETVKEFPVSFTLFLSCAPEADRCFLLRLSALDLALR